MKEMILLLIFVNFSITIERTHHTDVRFFDIQGCKESGDIIITHIPGVINPVDNLTKTFGLGLIL